MCSSTAANDLPRNTDSVQTAKSPAPSTITPIQRTMDCVVLRVEDVLQRAGIVSVREAAGWIVDAGKQMGMLALKPPHLRSTAREVFAEVAKAEDYALLVELRGWDMEIDSADGRSLLLYLLSSNFSPAVIVGFHKEARVHQKMNERLRDQVASLEACLGEKATLPRLEEVLAAPLSEKARATIVRAAAEIVRTDVLNSTHLRNIRRGGAESSLYEKDSGRNIVPFHTYVPCLPGNLHLLLEGVCGLSLGVAQPLLACEREERPIP